MCTNTKTLTSLKLATKTPQHFLFFSGFVLILSSSFSLSVYMNDLACICAGSIHKRPSVQSDKVPISQSCDSDFLSVCQTAAEGLSIRARAHILSHLLKHKLTRARREAWKPLSSSSFFCCSVCHGGETGKLWVILNCSVDFIWTFEEQRSEGEWISCIEPAAFSVTDYLRAKFRHISAFIKVSAFIIPLFKKDTAARHPSHLQSFLLLFQFCLSAPQKSRRHKRIFHRTTLPSCGCMLPLKRDHKTIHAGFTLKLHVWQFGKIWLISKRCKTHLMVSGRHMKILCKWILLNRRGYTHTHSHTGWRVIHLNPTLCPQHQILPFGPTHARRCDHNPSTLCLTLVIDRSQAPIGSSNSFTNLSFHIIDWVVLHPSFNYMQR